MIMSVLLVFVSQDCLCYNTDVIIQVKKASVNTVLNAHALRIYKHYEKVTFGKMMLGDLRE